MSDHRGACVVVGNGVAGLLAASALNSTGCAVKVIGLSEANQNKHRLAMHNVLTGGQVAIEILFPGMLKFLKSSGQASWLPLSDGAEIYEFGRLIEAIEGELGYFSARLDKVLLKAMRDDLKQRGVEFIEDRVTGLLIDDGRVGGVHALDNKHMVDLVVDASGRNSPIASALRANRILGPELKRPCGTNGRWFATITYEVASDHDPFGEQPKFILVLPDADSSGYVLISPGSHNSKLREYSIAISGTIGDRPASVLEYAISLSKGIAADSIIQLEEVGRKVHEVHFAQKLEVVQPYHLIESHQLEGLAVVGNALRTFNPQLGLGVTGAGWDAVALLRAIHRADNDLALFDSSEFFRDTLVVTRAGLTLGDIVSEFACTPNDQKLFADGVGAFPTWTKAAHLVTPNAVVELTEELRAKNFPIRTVENQISHFLMESNGVS